MKNRKLNNLIDIQWRRLKEKEVELEELYLKGKTEVVERELYFIKGRLEQLDEIKMFMKSLKNE